MRNSTPKFGGIGYLSAAEQTADSPRTEKLLLALRELGYIEAQNSSSKYHYSEGKRDRNSQLAAELVHLKGRVVIPMRLH